MSALMTLKHKEFTSTIELNDTKTASAIAKAMPMKAAAEVWKEEIYFEIPVARGQERGTARVQPGDVTYWPPGRCFCVFFGNSQPVSEVTLIGKVESNSKDFKRVRHGDIITLE